MSDYKIDKDLFNQITDYFNKYYNILYDSLIPGNGKYYHQEKNEEIRRIVIAFRENHNENFDQELAVYIHELGHSIQFKEKPELRLQEKLKFSQEKEAWEKGWDLISNEREKLSLDMELFKPKYEEIKKICLRTYYKNVKEGIHF